MQYTPNNYFSLLERHFFKEWYSGGCHKVAKYRTVDLSDKNFLEIEMAADYNK